MGIDRRLRDPCYHLAATHFYAMACVIGDDLWSSDPLNTKLFNAFIAWGVADDRAVTVSRSGNLLVD
ncbi:Uncharacterised protein [Vibrio cholerae]|nr:Uncharacterised protein [Vibrio cholerae]